MSRLTRDGTAEPVSRDQIIRHARGQGNVHFPCSADHEQDWHPYPVDPYSAICDDHTYMHIHSSIVYTPSHAKTSSHSHPQKQSLGLRHNKALACIPPARSWLLLRVVTSRAREGCQPVRQTVLFLILLLQEDEPVGHVSCGKQKGQTASQYSSVYS